MNFKPNAWTLLFALAIGALLFNMCGVKKISTAKTAEVVPLKPISLCPITELPMNEFFSDYGRYWKYADSLEYLFTHGAKDCPSLANLFNEYRTLVNPNIRSFKIPKCEMREMLALNPDGEYYAYLVMKNPKTDSMVIDLAFSHGNYQGGNNSNSYGKEGDVLAAKGDKNKIAVFDFTQPCPDSCDE